MIKHEVGDLVCLDRYPNKIGYVTKRLDDVGPRHSDLYEVNFFTEDNMLDPFGDEYSSVRYRVGELINSKSGLWENFQWDVWKKAN
jgi:hypothetical protein